MGKGVGLQCRAAQAYTLLCFSQAVRFCTINLFVLVFLAVKWGRIVQF